MIGTGCRYTVCGQDVHMLLQLTMDILSWPHLKVKQLAFNKNRTGKASRSEIMWIASRSRVCVWGW